MGHFKKVCKKCGVVISQCRCPSKDKTLIYEVCDDCSNGLCIKCKKNKRVVLKGREAKLCATCGVAALEKFVECEEHKEVKRYKYMHSGDCYLYVVECSCGEKPGGWTPEEADESWEKHKNEM